MKNIGWNNEATILSLILIGLIGLLAVILNYYAGFKYKISIDSWTYHCQEYHIEDNTLYLTDCSSEDTVIHNPVNYRIEER